MKPLEIFSGNKFGQLTVKYEVFQKSRLGRLFLCECTCGNTKLVCASYLHLGKITSCGCRFRLNPGDTSWRRLYKQYQRGAKERNYSFDLSLQEFKKLCSQICFYCGAEPRKFNSYLDNQGNLRSKKIRSVSSIERAWINANGIDRKNNSQGYYLSNCLPCCSKCNTLKTTFDYEDFLNQIKLIMNHISQ